MLGGLVRLGATVASYGFSTSLTPKLAGALGERGASALRVLSGKLALQNRMGASNLAARAARFVTPYASESGSFLDIMNRTNEHIINRLGGSGTRLTQAYAFLRREAVNEAYSMPAHLTWYSVEKNRATSREEKDRTKSFMSWYFPEQVPFSFISGVGLSTVQGSVKGTVRRYLQRRAETRPGGNTDFLNAYIASARTMNRIGDEMAAISMAKRATFEDKSILYATDPRRTAGYFREFRENLKRERAFADLTRVRSKMTYGYLERDPYAVTVLRQMRDYKWKQEQYLESMKKTHGITKDSDRMGATGESFAEYAQRFRNSTQGFTEKMIEQYNKVLAKDSMFIKRWNKYFSHDGKGEIARHREMFAPRWELGPGEVLSDTVEIGDAARRLSRRPYEMYVDPAVMRLGNAEAGEPQRVVDLHRMGSSYMIDSAIRSSGKGLPGFLTSLFGLKEVIQFQRMESQLGTSFESFHRGGNLVFPFAIKAQTGSREMVNPDHESLTDLISRSLVFEDSSPEKRQHIADAVIRSRKAVLAQHPDLRLYRDGSMSARKDLVSGPDGDAILDTMLSKGVFPVGKGDTLVHLPGGEMYLTTSVRVPGDNAQTAIMDLGRFVSSKDPITFLKYTSADSAPTRAIRSFHGMQSVRVGAGAYETNVVVGPNQTGRVMAEYVPGMFGGKSAAERLDFGASKEMGILRRWKRFFTKWTDPKNPHVLYSEDYLGDPRGRFIDKLVEESGHSLKSADDLSNMLRSQGTDMWDSIYVGLLKKRHMTTKQLYAGVKEHPTPWFRTEGEDEVPIQMGELIIKHTDTVEDAARKKDLLLDLLTTQGKDDSIGANIFRDDIMTLTTIGSQLVPSADRTAGEILGATRASRQAYVGYRKYDMSNLDVYNATVMKVVDSTAYIDNTIYGTPAFPSIFGNMKGIVDADTLRLHDHARRVTGIGYELKKQIMDTDQFDSDSMRGTQGRIQTILRGFMGETSRDMDGLLGYFRSNRKHAVWSIADADTREKVSPSPWGDTFLIAGSHPDAGIVKKQGNTTTGIMDVKNLSVMTLLHAFNRAASEFLDIGFDEYLTSTPGQYASKLLTKRVLPFMGIYAAYITADRMTDYWMDGTPLGEGVGVAAANAVAGARLTAQGVMDLTGITHLSKWAEDLMPGIIESPLSGTIRGIGVPLASIAMGYRMGGPGGALTGGAIGSAVGMLLGGGPAGLFNSWNPDKSRAEIIEELTGEQEVPIRSGRWWELCLVGDTFVQTQNGLTYIKDVVPGDTIVTHRGSKANVSATSTRKDTRLITIVGSPLVFDKTTVTPEHPLLTWNGSECSWTTAENIAKGTFMAYPLQKRTVKTISLSQYVSSLDLVLSENISGKSKLTVLQKSCSGSTLAKTRSSITVARDSRIRLDYDFGLIIGQFLGDGNIFLDSDKSRPPRGIEIAFGPNEYEKAVVVSQAITKVFRSDAPIVKDTHRNMFRIRCLNTLIGAIFLSMFGGTNKVPPEWMYRVNNLQFYTGILSGLIDSDASIYLGCVSFVNTNVNIMHLFWVSCAYLHVLPTTQIKEPDRTKYPSAKTAYQLTITQWDSYILSEKTKAHKLKNKEIIPQTKQSNYVKKRGFIESEGVTYVIWEVQNVLHETTIATDVYDICVENNDHSFIGACITYHNSKAPFEGDRISYYRPHLYALMRAKAKRTPGNNDSLITELVGHVAPDIYAVKNYYSRPYPKTAGIGANIPIFGNVMAMAPGLPIGGGITMHGDELSAHAISEMNIKSGMIPDVALLANDLSGGDGIFANTNPYGQDVQSDLGFFPGFAGPRPIEKSGFQWAMGESVGQMKDIVGLRGFLGGVAFQAASGHQDFYDSAPEFDTPASVNNFSRLFYDRNLGGLAGACVAGDQLVDTINGLRRIDNIKVGDLILSRDGQYRKVLTVFKRERQETLFAIRCDGLPFDLRITGNHKVIVHRKRPCIDGNKRPCVPSNNKGKCIDCPKNITIDDPFLPTRSIHQDSKWAATSTFYYTGMTQEAAEAYEYAEKHGVESLKVLETETGIKCSSKHTIYDITRRIKKGNSPDRYPLMVSHFEKNSMSTLRIGDYLVRAIHEISDGPEMIIDLSQYAGEYPFTNKYIYSKRPSYEYIAAYEFLEERYNSGEKLPTSTKLSKQLNIPRSVAKDVLKRKRNNTPPTRWERYVTITSELAYFFGWYVAEGNVDDGNVCLTMHRKELNYATQLSEIIMRTFSRPCKIQIGGPNGNSLRFKFHHPILALFLPIVFGSNCYTKMIPSLYWRNNKKVAEQYLRGLFLGDGCNMMSASHRSQDCSFHTTSISLAVTFHDILAALDICSSIGRSKTYGKNVESYIVHINKHNSIKLCNLLDLKTGDVDRENFQVERDRVFIRYGFVHYPIRKIEKDGNQEKMVFDLEVEEVHYYHANQICISNSEILRRYMTKRRGQIDVFNPIRSSMPDWLPGPGSFIDLQTGDAMTKIPEGEVRLPGAGYLTLHDVDISMPITSDILGQDYESQVAYLLGISSQVQPRNVQMSQAKAIASMLGRKAEEMGVLMRNNPAVYDPHGDVMASADFVANIGTKGMMPVKVAPKGFGGEGGLNAFMVLGGFEAGQLIEVDPKSGRYTPRIIRKDIDRYIADLEDAKASREAALSMIPTLESRDKSFNLGNAYSWADRFKILGDVAPYSHEFERTKNVMEARRSAGVMSGREERIYDETLRQNEERRKAFSFNEYRFTGLGDSLTQAGRDRDEAIRDEYSMTERAIGGAWEYMTHLRTPINTKLLGQYSALEEYRRTSIYGTKVPMWENPIDDYLLPYAQSMVNEDDPIQAGLSFGMGSLLVGAAFGGAPLAFTGMMGALGVGVGTANRAFGSPDLPGRVEKRRDIQEQVDAVNYAKNMLLESETGLLQYRYAAQRTFTGMALSGQIPTVDDLRTMLPFPERDFVGEIISNVKGSNVDAARALLPKIALPTLEQEIGNTQEAGSVLREVADSLSERSQAIPGIESTIYGRNVPISAPAITTYEQEGLSAHDGGFGWYKQMSDINTMKAYGVYSSRDSIYGTASPHVPEFERGDSVRSAINMNNALRSRLSVFGNVTISGEGDGFGIIVEIIQTG